MVEKRKADESFSDELSPDELSPDELSPSKKIKILEDKIVELKKRDTDAQVMTRNMIEKLIDSENKVKDPYDFSGKKIWMLINFELWMRTFID